MNRKTAAPFLSVACIAAVAAVTLPGCGKPEYCAKRADFSSSVSTLTSVSLTPPNPTEINTNVTNVQNAGTAMLNAAKSDFPNQTTALENALDAVVATGKELTTTKDPAGTGLTLAAQLLTLNAAWKSFDEATNDACK